MPTYSEIPKGLDLSEQLLICIGKLIAEWANLESVFYVAFFCLAGRPNGNADIAWASIQSTRRRMQMVNSFLQYEEKLTPEVRRGLQKCLEEFRGITDARNYYCHATYRTNDELEIVSIEQWSLAPIEKETDLIFKEKSKNLSKATINEICCTIDNCQKISVRATKLVYKLRDELRLQHVKLPPLPDQYR
jgi:hypothetical protein